MVATLFLRTRGRFYSLLVLRVGYSYDIHNKLTGLSQTVNGVEQISSYTYDDDNRVTSVTADGVTVEYTYDALGRVSQQVTKQGETTVLTESFTYTTVNGNTSAQIATYTTTTAIGTPLTNAIVSILNQALSSR